MKNGNRLTVREGRRQKHTHTFIAMWPRLRRHLQNTRCWAQGTHGEEVPTLETRETDKASSQTQSDSSAVGAPLDAGPVGSLLPGDRGSVDGRKRRREERLLGVWAGDDGSPACLSPHACALGKLVLMFPASRPRFPGLALVANPNEALGCHSRSCRQSETAETRNPLASVVPVCLLNAHRVRGVGRGP